MLDEFNGKQKKEKVYDFTKDLGGKYLLANKYLISIILADVLSDELKGFSLSEIFDMLPSSKEDSNFIETLSQEFGGFESKTTERDILFRLDINIDDINSILNINLELERSKQSGYDLVNRALVYACQNLLSTTLGEEYDDVYKTYSIWICMKNHISSVEGVEDKTNPLSFIHKYSMGKKDNISGDIVYNERVDKINLVFIELGALIKNINTFGNYENYNLIVEHLTQLFKEQTKTELDNTLMNLSKKFDGKEIEKGDDIMTSRILSMAQLEEDKIKAEEDKIKAEEDKIKAEEDKIKAEEDKIKAEEDKIKAEEDKIKAEEDKIKAEEDTVMLKKIMNYRDRGYSKEEAILKVATDFNKSEEEIAELLC